MSYQIKVAGVLDKSWSDWLGEANIVTEKLEDGSMVTKMIVDENDQPKLFGILDQIRDLNLTLLEVKSDEIQLK